MKKTTTLCAFAALLLTAAPARSEGGEEVIDALLRQIETNNKSLQANAKLVSAQKMENRVANNLPDPTLSYSHLWDSDDKHITEGELVISQSFDFPTLYIARNRLNRLKGNALDAQAADFRQTLLLQAKEVCLDIILLHRRQGLLDERLKNAEELAALYGQRLRSGDANALETNKINLELLNVRTESRLNRTALDNKLKELTALNGNLSPAPGRPMPDGQAPGAEALGLTDYPTMPLPASFGLLCEELLAADPALQALQGERDAARKQVAADRQGWLPKLELGYRRNTEDRHPLNGVVVGFSFPLFENRNKVKMARTRVLSLDYRQEDASSTARSALWQLYEEARRLQASIQEYEDTFARQQDLSLLRKALDGGQISMIEYFVEVSLVYQSKDNLLELENRYQKAMARLYKSRL